MTQMDEDIAALTGQAQRYARELRGPGDEVKGVVAGRQEVLIGS